MNEKIYLYTLIVNLNDLSKFQCQETFKNYVNLFY